jgi:CheY-like chemotaxis protein
VITVRRLIRLPTGVEAVQQALALKPEIALVRIGLPEISGYQVARQVRDVLGPTIALIALTGYGQATLRNGTGRG